VAQAVSIRRSALRSPVAYLFILPALAIFTVFTIAPTLFTFVISTFRWNYLNAAQSRFTGLQNYQDMVDGAVDPPFGQTMLTSAYFVVAMVVGGTAISLALAMLLRAAGRIFVAGRAMVFLAYVTPLVATSIVWIWIFNPRYGLANVVLNLFGIPNIDWLGNSASAMPAVIIYSLWHEIGFTTVVFVGGLTTMSAELSEAARLDGCSRWQEFWYVTFPQLRPVVTFVVVISAVSSLQAFTQFFTMTGGGPGYATATLGFQLYQQAFVFRRTGYAAALALVLFLVTVALSVLQLRTTRSIGRSTQEQS
jgi:ABC-type sugar transport system permease subunit